jgi:CTP synthase (UTP-ammonia lyase)
MNTAITITPTQLIEWLLAICAGISCIAVAISWIVKGIKAAKAPDKRQDERIKVLETKTKDYDTYFAKDKTRLDNLETGNRVTQRAILALLAHGIDGNEVEAMKSAKAELQDYLIKR